MGANDTIMSRVQVNKFWKGIGLGSFIPTQADYGENHPTYKLLKAQDKISFKAGRESLLGEKVVAETLKRERQKGIMKVVEWLKNNEHDIYGSLMAWSLWQAQLKSWNKERSIES